MNILIINIHSSTNVGDAALTLQTIAGLQHSFPGCALTAVALATNPKIRFGSK